MLSDYTIRMSAKSLYMEFFDFCSSVLVGENPKILDLIQHRYNDCGDGFCDSQEMVRLLTETKRKMEEDKPRLFVHLKEFTDVLKANCRRKQKSGGEKKRKRQRQHDRDSERNQSEKSVVLECSNDSNASCVTGSDDKEITEDESSEAKRRKVQTIRASKEGEIVNIDIDITGRGTAKHDKDISGIDLARHSLYNLTNGESFSNSEHSDPNNTQSLSSSTKSHPNSVLTPKTRILAGGGSSNFEMQSTIPESHHPPNSRSIQSVSVVTVTNADAIIRASPVKNTSASSSPRKKGFVVSNGLDLENTMPSIKNYELSKSHSLLRLKKCKSVENEAVHAKCTDIDRRLQDEGKQNDIGKSGDEHECLEESGNTRNKSDKDRSGRCESLESAQEREGQVVNVLEGSRNIALADSIADRITQTLESATDEACSVRAMLDKNMDQSDCGSSSMSCDKVVGTDEVGMAVNRSERDDGKMGQIIQIAENGVDSAASKSSPLRTEESVGGTRNDIISSGDDDVDIVSNVNNGNLELEQIGDIEVCGSIPSIDDVRRVLHPTRGKTLEDKDTVSSMNERIRNTSPSVSEPAINDCNKCQKESEHDADKIISCDMTDQTGMKSKPNEKSVSKDKNSPSIITCGDTASIKNDEKSSNTKKELMVTLEKIDSAEVLKETSKRRITLVTVNDPAEPQSSFLGSLSLASKDSGLVPAKDKSGDLSSIPSCHKVRNKDRDRISSLSSTKDVASDTGSNSADEFSSAKAVNYRRVIEDAKVKGKKPPSERHIQKLENLLEKLRDEIEKGQELSLAEMDEEDSYYIYEDKLKKKFVAAWTKLCEITDRTVTTGRPTERTIRFSGTRYKEINRRLEKFLNKKKQFPDFQDVKTIVRMTNNKCSLHLGAQQINDVAREAFVDIGEMLQTRRHQDFIASFGSRETETYSAYRDPALTDPELRRKLDSNRKIGRSNLDAVISKYTELQYTKGTAENDDSDDDSGEDESEDDGKRSKRSTGKKNRHKRRDKDEGRIKKDKKRERKLSSASSNDEDKEVDAVASPVNVEVNTEKQKGVGLGSSRIHNSSQPSSPLGIAPVSSSSHLVLPKRDERQMDKNDADDSDPISSANAVTKPFKGPNLKYTKRKPLTPPRVGLHDFDNDDNDDNDNDDGLTRTPLVGRTSILSNPESEDETSESDEDRENEEGFGHNDEDKSKEEDDDDDLDVLIVSSDSNSDEEDDDDDDSKCPSPVSVISLGSLSDDDEAVENEKAPPAAMEICKIENICSASDNPVSEVIPHVVDLNDVQEVNSSDKDVDVETNNDETCDKDKRNEDCRATSSLLRTGSSHNVTSGVVQGTPRKKLMDSVDGDDLIIILDTPEKKSSTADEGTGSQFCDYSIGSSGKGEAPRLNGKDILEKPSEKANEISSSDASDSNGTAKSIEDGACSAGLNDIDDDGDENDDGDAVCVMTEVEGSNKEVGRSLMSPGGSDENMGGAVRDDDGGGDDDDREALCVITNVGTVEEADVSSKLGSGEKEEKVVKKRKQKENQEILCVISDVEGGDEGEVSTDGGSSSFSMADDVSVLGKTKKNSEEVKDDNDAVCVIMAVVGGADEASIGEDIGLSDNGRVEKKKNKRDEDAEDKSDNECVIMDVEDRNEKKSQEGEKEVHEFKEGEMEVDEFKEGEKEVHEFKEGEKEVDEFKEGEKEVDEFKEGEKEVDEFKEGEKEVDEFKEGEKEVDEFKEGEKEVHEFKEGEKEVDEFKEGEKEVDEFKEGEKEVDEFKEGEKEVDEFKEGEKEVDEFKEGEKEVHEFKEGEKEVDEFKEGEKEVHEFKEGEKEVHEFKEGEKEVDEFKEGEKEVHEFKAGEKEVDELKEGHKEVDESKEDCVHVEGKEREQVVDVNTIMVLVLDPEGTEKHVETSGRDDDEEEDMNNDSDDDDVVVVTDSDGSEGKEGKSVNATKQQGVNDSKGKHRKQDGLSAGQGVKNSKGKHRKQDGLSAGQGVKNSKGKHRKQGGLSAGQGVKDSKGKHRKQDGLSAGQGVKNSKRKGKDLTGNEAISEDSLIRISVDDDDGGIEMNKVCDAGDDEERSGKEGKTAEVAKEEKEEESFEKAIQLIIGGRQEPLVDARNDKDDVCGDDIKEAGKEVSVNNRQFEIPDKLNKVMRSEKVDEKTGKGVGETEGKGRVDSPDIMIIDEGLEKDKKKGCEKMHNLVAAGENGRDPLSCIGSVKASTRDACVVDEACEDWAVSKSQDVEVYMDRMEDEEGEGKEEEDVFVAIAKLCHSIIEASEEEEKTEEGGGGGGATTGSEKKDGGGVKEGCGGSLVRRRGSRRISSDKLALWQSMGGGGGVESSSSHSVWLFVTNEGEVIEKSEDMQDGLMRNNTIIKSELGEEKEKGDDRQSWSLQFGLQEKAVKTNLFDAEDSKSNVQRALYWSPISTGVTTCSQSEEDKREIGVELRKDVSSLVEGRSRSKRKLKLDGAASTNDEDSCESFPNKRRRREKDLDLKVVRVDSVPKSLQLLELKIERLSEFDILILQKKIKMERELEDLQPRSPSPISSEGAASPSPLSMDTEASTTTTTTTTTSCTNTSMLRLGPRVSVSTTTSSSLPSSPSKLNKNSAIWKPPSNHPNRGNGQPQTKPPPPTQTPQHFQPKMKGVNWDLIYASLPTVSTKNGPPSAPSQRAGSSNNASTSRHIPRPSSSVGFPSTKLQHNSRTSLILNNNNKSRQHQQQRPSANPRMPMLSQAPGSGNAKQYPPYQRSKQNHSTYKSIPPHKTTLINNSTRNSIASLGPRVPIPTITQNPKQPIVVPSRHQQTFSSRHVIRPVTATPTPSSSSTSTHNKNNNKTNMQNIHRSSKVNPDPRRNQTTSALSGPAPQKPHHRPHPPPRRQQQQAPHLPVNPHRHQQSQPRPGRPSAHQLVMERNSFVTAQQKKMDGLVMILDDSDDDDGDDKNTDTNCNKQKEGGRKSNQSQGDSCANKASPSSSNANSPRAGTLSQSSNNRPIINIKANTSKSPRASASSSSSSPSSSILPIIQSVSPSQSLSSSASLTARNSPVAGCGARNSPVAGSGGGARNSPVAGSGGGAKNSPSAAGGSSSTMGPITKRSPHSNPKSSPHTNSPQAGQQSNTIPTETSKAAGVIVLLSDSEGEET